MCPLQRELLGITYLPRSARLLGCQSGGRARSYQGISSRGTSMCDLRCYFILHLYNINPTEYFVKQLQAVSFKETSDNPKMPVSPGT